jgi:hypothetical protein
MAAIVCPPLLTVNTDGNFCNLADGEWQMIVNTSNADTVFIGGELRKSKGKLVGVDLKRVGRLAQQSRDYVVSKAGWPGTRMGGYSPGH